MSFDDRAVGTPERLHPLFLLTGLGGSLRGMAGGYAFIAYLAATGQLWTAAFVAVLLFALLAISVTLYWTRFEFRVGENEIRVDSGILSRTHRSIPFDRIQDVEISQGPVARLFNLAKVKFETGGSAGSNDDEGVLQAITLERAQQIRSLIRAKRAATPEFGVEAAGAEVPPVFAMDLKRVLLAGVFNFSLALFAGLFGPAQTAGDLMGFDPLNRQFWAGVLSSDHPVTRFVLEHRPAAVAAGLVLLLAIGLLTGIARTLLRDYGFRLDRSPVGLRRRRGLLTKSDVTLPAARVQAAVVATGPVREAFGWRELKMQSLARDEGGKGDHVLAPLAREEEIRVVLQELGWRAVPPNLEWRKVSVAYLWTLLIGLAPLYLLALVQAALLAFAWTAVELSVRPAVMRELAPLLLVFCGVLLAIFAILGARWLAWRRTRYVLDRDRLMIRTGWWRRRTLILPVRRIQSIEIRQSFVSRWFGAAWLIFGVAGGSGFSAHAIPALHEKSARDLREELLSRRA